MSKIVSASVTLRPTLHHKIRGLEKLTVAAIPRPADIKRVPELDPIDPTKVTPATLDHAREVAERVISTMGELPHDQRAADLLAMAFTIRHYHGQGGSR